MIKRFLITIALTLGILLPAPAAMAFNPLGSVCGQQADSPICNDVNQQNADNKNPVAKVLGTVADIIAVIAGVAAVILIIVGGLNMVTSAGNPESVNTGRKRIISAVIGLVIIVLAWTIVTFFVSRL